MWPIGHVIGLCIIIICSIWNLTGYIRDWNGSYHKLKINSTLLYSLSILYGYCHPSLSVYLFTHIIYSTLLYMDSTCMKYTMTQFMYLNNYSFCQSLSQDSSACSETFFLSWLYLTSFQPVSGHICCLMHLIIVM